MASYCSLTLGASTTRYLIFEAELAADSAPLGAQSGDRLPGSPEFQASLGLQTDFSMAGRPTFARADIAHI